MDKCFFLFILLWNFALFSLSPSDLSLEEKVGQLLMVHFHGQEANKEAAELIQQMHVGGIIYYNWANDLKTPQQVHALSQGLQQLAQKTPHSISLFIAVDQEGGRVTRLRQGFTVFPGNYALGKTGEWEWGEKSAWMMGEELKAVGVSLNLAPVVDVYTQLANPVVGIRAFSSNPIQVTKWGDYTLRGYKKAGIIATLKHFPGHGDVQVDSHEALPVVKKSREKLDQEELYPFRHLAAQAEVIMTAHVLFPAIDEKECVTFSKKAVHDLLRNEFHFQGVIMTDSLAMEGALRQCHSLEEAVLRSLEAGHDLILLGGKQLLASQSGLEFKIDDVKRVYHFLLDAVKQGKLSEKRIDASVARILALKEKYQLFDCNSPLLETEAQIAPHRMLAQHIAQRALHVVKGEHLLPISVTDSSVVIVAPECLREEIMQTDWHLGKSQIIYFKELNPTPSSIQEALSLIKEHHKIGIYFAYNAWQFPGQQELFQQIKRRSSCAIAIVSRDFLDCDSLKNADVLLCTFSPVAYSLQAAFHHLNGIHDKDAPSFRE